MRNEHLKIVLFIFCRGEVLSTSAWYVPPSLAGKHYRSFWMIASLLDYPNLPQIIVFVVRHTRHQIQYTLLELKRDLKKYTLITWTKTWLKNYQNQNKVTRGGAALLCATLSPYFFYSQHALVFFLKIRISPKIGIVVDLSADILSSFAIPRPIFLNVELEAK